MGLVKKLLLVVVAAGTLTGTLLRHLWTGLVATARMVQAVAARGWETGLVMVAMDLEVYTLHVRRRGQQAITFISASRDTLRGMAEEVGLLFGAEGRGRLAIYRAGAARRGRRAAGWGGGGRRGGGCISYNFA